jgi:hypothetical protein
MTARDLAARLMETPDLDVMILDGFNGGGVPRTINLGPSSHIISAVEERLTADCEHIVGHKVVILGYGCY